MSLFLLFSFLSMKTILNLHELTNLSILFDSIKLPFYGLTVCMSFFFKLVFVLILLWKIIAVLIESVWDAIAKISANESHVRLSYYMLSNVRCPYVYTVHGFKLKLFILKISILIKYIIYIYIYIIYIYIYIYYTQHISYIGVYI